MCIRDSGGAALRGRDARLALAAAALQAREDDLERAGTGGPVSYTHLRAHETVLDLVCRLLLEKKKKKKSQKRQ